MFGPRLTRVFASRNNALWWSAMVLVTAYCVAAEPPAGTGSGANEEETSQANGQDMASKGADKKTSDPWADMKAVAQKRGELLP